MEKRKILNMGLAVLAATVMLATSLNAVNFREAKASAWESEKSVDAIKKMFGEGKLHTTDKIRMTAPSLAQSPSSISVRLKSKMDIETIAFFQDANPRSSTVVFSVPDGQNVDYTFRIKMRQSAFVTVVAKTRDGKLHTLKREIEVNGDGCGG